MASDPAAFLRGVMHTNLPLAARAAAQPELMPSLPAELLDTIRTALVERTEDPAADLRHRIVCGYALGALGDPRFERRVGPHGDYILPPLIQIRGGRYPIGEDEPIGWDHPTSGRGESRAHIPRHEVELAPFRIGRFTVTNAEWASFMAAGGYDDERWWDTADGRTWRRGEMPRAAQMENKRLWRERLQADPDLFDRMVENSVFVSKESERA